MNLRFLLACQVRPLGSSGLLGEMVLVTWAFAQPVPFAAEVVAKFTPASKKLQAISLTLGLFSCEFHYYRYLSARSAVRCPQVRKPPSRPSSWANPSLC